MQQRTRVKDGKTVVDVIDPSDGNVSHSIEVGEGEQVTVTALTASSPADLEVIGPEAIPAEGVPAGEPTGGDPAEGEPTEPTEGNEPGEAQTSASSDKPLYRVQADPIPEGFVPSGLATPEGVVLYHYEGDTAGEASTAELGDETGVYLYADADDDGQPVVTVEGDAGTEANEQSA
jgi:hypothetical protein